MKARKVDVSGRRAIFFGYGDAQLVQRLVDLKSRATWPASHSIRIIGGARDSTGCGSITTTGWVVPQTTIRQADPLGGVEISSPASLVPIRSDAHER